MINVAVFNVRDLLKYLLKFIIIVLAICLFVKSYQYIQYLSFKNSINRTIPVMAYLNTNTENSNKISFIEYILNTQLAVKNSIIAKEEDFGTLEQGLVENIEIANNEIQTDALTQVVLENNIATTYTNRYKSVEVKNSSKYSLTEEILTPNIDLKNKNDIIIFHTHTTESYTPTEKFSYNMVGSYRSTDLNYTVSRVGDELQNYLEQRRI